MIYSATLCLELPCQYHKASHLWLFQFSSVQSLNPVRLFASPWTVHPHAHQASLSITNSRILLKLLSVELVISRNHLILCHSVLLLPSVCPSSCGYLFSSCLQSVPAAAAI